MRMLEGFSAYDIASRRQVVAGLAVLSGSALLQPVRQWMAGLPAPAARDRAHPETIASWSRRSCCSAAGTRPAREVYGARPSSAS